jgi:hypothetical protein
MTTFLVYRSGNLVKRMWCFFVGFLCFDQYYTNLCRGFAYRNESLRVAYVDEVKLDGKTTTHYSKLVKVDGMDKEKDQVLFFSISVLDSAITHD